MSIQLQVIAQTVAIVILVAAFLYILWGKRPWKNRNKIYLYGASGIAETGELLKEVVVDRNCAHMVIGGSKLASDDNGQVCFSASSITYIDKKGDKYSLEIEDGVKVHISKTNGGIQVQQESMFE
jgi:hypothetical protein